MIILSKEARLAETILKWMYKHGDIRYVSIKIECEGKKAGVTEVLNEMKPYTDYIEGINSYRLNAEGCKYVKSLRNANAKNKMVKETSGGNHKTCQIDSRPLVSILSFEKKTFIHAQGDNPHVDMSNSRRSSFWDFLQDVIKRLLGKF